MPEHKVFMPEDYGAHQQNWGAVQDPRGILYVGNGSGILRYDGEEWQLFELPSGSAVYSLAYANDRIFVGGNNDFGYFQYAENGTLVYQSLMPQVPDSLKNFGRLRKMVKTGQGVYGFSERVLFFAPYDQEKPLNYHATKNEETRFLGFYTHNKQHVLHQPDGSFVRVYDNGKAQEAMPFRPLAASLTFFEAWQADTLLISTARSGLFGMLSQSEARPTPLGVPEVDELFKKHGCIAQAQLKNGKLALGFLNGTVAILDPAERYALTALYNPEEQALPQAPVIALYEDYNQNLWVLTGEGIAFLALGSPLRKIDEQWGTKGRINQVAALGKHILLATDAGVFTATTQHTKRVKPLVEGGANRLIPLKNQKLVAIGSAITLLGLSETGEPTVQDTLGLPAYAHGSDVFLSGETEAFVLLTTANDYNFILHIEGEKLSRYPTPFSHDFRHVSLLADGENTFFGATAHEGIFKLRFHGKDSLELLQQYDTTAGLRSLHWQNVFRFSENGKEHVIVPSAGQWLSYSPEKDSFEENSALNVFLEKSKYLSHDEFTGEFLTQDAFALWHPLSEGKYEKIEEGIQALKDANLVSFFSIPEEKKWGFYNSSALYVYDHKAYAQKSFDFPLYVTLKEIHFSGTDSVLLSGQKYAHEALEYNITGNHLSLRAPIAYAYNGLHFEFACPLLEASEQLLYRTRLEGLDKDWSTWSGRGQREFNNLREGKYTLRVQAKDAYGRLSEETHLEFRVSPPWFRTVWAYLAYAVVLALAIWGGLYIANLRSRREQARLQKLVNQRTQEIQQQNKKLEVQQEELLEANAQLNQQKEEMAAQAESLLELNTEITTKNNEIGAQQAVLAQSYERLQTLGEIGQQLTAILNLRELAAAVQEKVSSLMPLDSFGIGIVDSAHSKLIFRGYYEAGKVLPDEADTLDGNNLSSKCFLENKEIWINDVGRDYEAVMGYALSPEELEGGTFSLVYVPLLIDESPVGVLTVQSFQKKAYTETDIQLLKNLASYVSIAIENTQNLQVAKNRSQKIMDSIRYAQSIQQAVLPSQVRLKAAFPEHFLLYWPKDLVSGDFYWLKNTRTCRFFVAADCTGHGVPGGFMSMVGQALLVETFNQVGGENLALFLDTLDALFRTVLQQHDATNSDGIDLAILRIPRETKENDCYEIGFAGAHQEIIYKAPDKPTERLRGVNRSIGGVLRRKRDFVETQLRLPAESVIYLFSDGLVHQQNEEKEKWGIQRLVHFMDKNAELPPRQQGEEATRQLEAHKGQEEQRDDILWFGLRL